MHCTVRLVNTQAVIATILADVLAVYCDYTKVFSKKVANKLFKHKLQDYTINFYLST